jgi:hypothetical protein
MKFSLSIFDYTFTNYPIDGYLIFNISSLLGLGRVTSYQRKGKNFSTCRDHLVEQGESHDLI